MEKDKEYKFGIQDIDIAPEFKKVRGKKYIPYGYKQQNNYPDKLLYLYESSALHGAIVEGKSYLIAGNGFTFEEDQPKSKATGEFLANINEEDEDANEILDRLSLDLVIYGGYAVVITWTNDWKKIASIEYIDFSKIRAEEIGDNRKINGYFYAFDWTCYRPNAQYIPIFNEAEARENNRNFEIAKSKSSDDLLEFIEESRYDQIFVFNKHTPGVFYYPHPTYTGAIRAISADIQADIYADNSLKNGLSTDTVITFLGDNKSQNTKTRKSKLFDAQYTGANRAGKPIKLFAKDKDSAPIISRIPNNGVDMKYKVINENSLQKILAGHRVTSPLLVGIKTAGQLGGATELLTAFNIFYSSVIKPDQLKIAKTFNKFMEINELEVVSIEPIDSALLIGNEGEDKKAEGQEKGNNNEIKED